MANFSTIFSNSLLLFSFAFVSPPMNCYRSAMVKRGLKPNSAVGLFSINRVEWVIEDEIKEIFFFSEKL